MWNWNFNKVSINISIYQLYSISFNISMGIYCVYMGMEQGVIDFDLRKQKAFGPEQISLSR